MDNDDVLFNAIETFAQSISKEPFGLVYYRPDKDSVATNCISNVSNFVKRHGGSVIYGWYFCHRESGKFGNYLIATYHAVWRDPDGNLVDITHFHEDLKHQPLTNQGSVLFQVDTKAQPIKHGRFIIPRPSKFFPILKSKELKEYIKTLEEQEVVYYKENFGIKIIYSNK